VNVWLVIPARRRAAVTRLCLAQKQHLVRRLAVRGITANVVVVAEDENTMIGEQFGFDTVDYQGLDYVALGQKVNDGFAHAYERGADYVAFVGSDDWIHEAAFAPLTETGPGAPVVAGHEIAVVDLEGERMRTLGVRGPQGVSPWFIPRWALDRVAGRPAQAHKERGLEGSIYRTARLWDADWVFHDPHPLTRVDFKTSENMTPYELVAGQFGYGDEVAPWHPLAQRYPLNLVALAYETHKQLAAVAA